MAQLPISIPTAQQVCSECSCGCSVRVMAVSHAPHCVGSQELLCHGTLEFMNSDQSGFALQREQCSTLAAYNKQLHRVS